MKIGKKRRFRQQKGQSILEYALLLMLVGAVAVFILANYGSNISSMFSKAVVTIDDKDKSEGDE